jgi:D-glycero-D-manno-heptose 1,7-bisphosphate phosphatase
MHARMNQMLAKHGGRIDAVFFCPHAPEEQCECRKPLPGLMLQIGERYGVDLREVPFVGDSLRDLQAGATAGCPTHLVRTGKSSLLTESQVADMLRLVPGTQVHADLGAFVDALVQHERQLRGLTGTSDSDFGRLS